MSKLSDVVKNDAVKKVDYDKIAKKVNDIDTSGFSNTNILADTNVDKLFEECTENVEEVKLAKITSSENENKHTCCSCTLHMVLFQ